MAEKDWEKKIKAYLLNQKIVSIRYMPNKDADYQNWHKRPIQIKLSNGVWLPPSQDDEGNDGGSLHTNIKELPIIPVI